MIDRAIPIRPVTLVEAGYKGLQVVMDRFGEFLREISALVLVFIPVDLYRGQMTWQPTFNVFALAAFLFASGIGCEFAAIAVKRSRDKYEEEQASGSNSGT